MLLKPLSDGLFGLLNAILDKKKKKKAKESNRGLDQKLILWSRFFHSTFSLRERTIHPNVGGLEHDLSSALYSSRIQFWVHWSWKLGYRSPLCSARSLQREHESQVEVSSPHFYHSVDEDVLPHPNPTSSELLVSYGWFPYSISSPHLGFSFLGVSPYKNTLRIKVGSTSLLIKVTN